LGAQKSADRLSAVNGFLGNKAVEILMPEQAQKVEKTLRNMGWGNCRRCHCKHESPAEDASKSAAPIFVGAIKSMTVTDGLNILRVLILLQQLISAKAQRRIDESVHTCN